MGLFVLLLTLSLHLDSGAFYVGNQVDRTFLSLYAAICARKKATPTCQIVPYSTTLDPIEEVIKNQLNVI